MKPWDDYDVVIPPTRKERILNFIQNERKMIFAEVQDHAARMEAEAIGELMQELLIVNRLEDEARELSDS